MDHKLRDILQDKCGNYILPFFWQHGEEEDVLIEEIERIYQSGIRAMCVESRPHQGFCEEEWWDDFDLIMTEAKRRDMKVWLLDDKKFPTGFANGLIREKYPHLGKRHIQERHVDVVGPLKDATLLAGSKPGVVEDLICAVAYKRLGTGQELSTECVDLTNNVKGGFLYWDIPEGHYRVFFICKTRQGGRNDYIHMIDPESVDVLIEAVYEPHYQRYKEDFGNTFAGFFSDEPGFGNHDKTTRRDLTVGMPYVILPWRDDLVDLLSASIGEDASVLLPGLWYDIELQTSMIRSAYMEMMTTLYQENFCRKLGDWCRNRGIEYIGHVIEDANTHARLGVGAGHYFRSLDGQDMAGIDVVLHQIVPGFHDMTHASRTSSKFVDPAFYNYMLAKLAASHSHIQPRMKGRAMCEIFGAYGWAEGMPVMKWLTDHMLVRGINYFVPHAFSPKFPDHDCPPHFYARGENPQFRDFRVLMDYTNKMSHLLTDGRHIATAAVLYHAEAEWTGGKYMYTEVPVKALYDQQIDIDIVPIDTLKNSATVAESKLVIHKEQYDCLVIPYAEILPIKGMKRIFELAEDGLPVIFVDGFPVRSAENGDITPYLNSTNFMVVPINQLAEYLKEKGYFDLRLKECNPLVRCYHYEREDTHYFMFFNEDIYNSACVDVELPFRGRYVYLDLLQETVVTKETNGNCVKIELSPYQSCLIAFTEEEMEYISSFVKQPLIMETELTGPYQIMLTETKDYPNFELFRSDSELINITGFDYQPNFAGIMKYATTFTADESAKYTLDLGIVGETASVWVNGDHAGVRICPPYHFDVSTMVKAGENTLDVEVANTLVYKLQDQFSQYLLLPPSGLQGPVKLSKRKEGCTDPDRGSALASKPSGMR